MDRILGIKGSWGFSQLTNTVETIAAPENAVLQVNHLFMCILHDCDIKGNCCNSLMKKGKNQLYTNYGLWKYIFNSQTHHFDGDLVFVFQFTFLIIFRISWMLSLRQQRVHLVVSSSMGKLLWQPKNGGACQPMSLCYCLFCCHHWHPAHPGTSLYISLTTILL